MESVTYQKALGQPEAPKLETSLRLSLCVVSRINMTVFNTISMRMFSFLDCGYFWEADLLTFDRKNILNINCDKYLEEFFLTQT